MFGVTVLALSIKDLVNLINTSSLIFIVNVEIDISLYVFIQYGFFSSS